MTGRRIARSTTAWLWLPAAVTAGLVPVMFFVGMRSDTPEVRAGAEPVMAGIVLATPFVLLLLVQVLCALTALISESRQGRRRALVAATVAATSMAALAIWVVDLPAATDGSVERMVHTGLVVVALLVPFVPAWAVHRQENRRPAIAR